MRARGATQNCRLFFTIRDVAERLKVSQRTIRGWVDAGYLKVIKIGRTVRIDEVALGNLVRSSGKVARGPLTLRETEPVSALAEEVFARTWNNPQDAIYDHSRDIYGVGKGRRRAGRLSVSRSAGRKGQAGGRTQRRGL
jgi:excisionase family DNA binding protein